MALSSPERLRKLGRNRAKDFGKSLREGSDRGEEKTPSSKVRHTPVAPEEPTTKEKDKVQATVGLELDYEMKTGIKFGSEQRAKEAEQGED